MAQPVRLPYGSLGGSKYVHCDIKRRCWAGQVDGIGPRSQPASQPASQPGQENRSGTEGTEGGGVVEVATAGSQWLI